MGEELEEAISGYREQVVSFSSGASITYIFLQLIPEFQEISSNSTDIVFVFPLLGFSSIHLLEKYILKSSTGHEKMRKEFGEIHSSFLFLYHGAIGYLISSLFAQNTASGLLFFIPIILHVAVSSLSLTELHEDFAQRKSVKLAIALAPLIGVALHQFGNLIENYFGILFGTVIGMFIYVVIRDSIPEEDNGKPLEYLLGMLIYLIIIVFVKSF
jgi:hypothetical protein